MLTTDPPYPTHCGTVRRVDLVYHHVGTGRTESVYYCSTCDGFYGVPHDGDTHEHTRRRDFRYGCACRPCQEHFGIYPTEGEYRKVTVVGRSRR